MEEPVVGAGDPVLHEVLDEARRLGFLGSRPVEDVVAHALGFLPPLGDARQILDLGSGGGVPGLVLAAAQPGAVVTLLDASERRTDWLRRVVSRLGWTKRVSVVTGRAEVLGQRQEWRGGCEGVVARGFGRPTVTAECAAPFLQTGGRLVVSEPPHADAARWPLDVLAELGLRRRPWHDPAYAVFEQIAPCPPSAPRAKVLRGRP